MKITRITKDEMDINGFPKRYIKKEDEYYDPAINEKVKSDETLEKRALPIGKLYEDNNNSITSITNPATKDTVTMDDKEFINADFIESQINKGNLTNSVENIINFFTPGEEKIDDDPLFNELQKVKDHYKDHSDIDINKKKLVPLNRKENIANTAAKLYRGDLSDDYSTILGPIQNIGDRVLDNDWKDLGSDIIELNSVTKDTMYTSKPGHTILTKNTLKEAQTRTTLILKNKNTFNKQLGFIYVKPFYSSEGNFENFNIPFEFKPVISEGSINAKYQAEELLSRIGAMQVYSNTDPSTITITTEYKALAPDEKMDLEDASRQNSVNAWEYYWTNRMIEQIELQYRSLVFPVVSFKKYLLRPPIIELKLSSPEYKAMDNIGYLYKYPFTVGDGADGNFESLSEYLKISGTSDPYKKFIVTSVQIDNSENEALVVPSLYRYSKDVTEGTEGNGINSHITTYNNKDESFMGYNTSRRRGFKVTLNCTEVTENFLDIVPDFKAYYNAWRSIDEISQVHNSIVENSLNSGLNPRRVLDALTATADSLGSSMESTEIKVEKSLYDAYKYGSYYCYPSKLNKLGSQYFDLLLPLYNNSQDKFFNDKIIENSYNIDPTVRKRGLEGLLSNKNINETSNILKPKILKNFNNPSIDYNKTEDDKKEDYIVNRVYRKGNIVFVESNHKQFENYDNIPSRKSRIKKVGNYYDYHWYPDTYLQYPNFDHIGDNGEDLVYNKVRYRASEVDGQKWENLSKDIIENNNWKSCKWLGLADNSKVISINRNDDYNNTEVTVNISDEVSSKTYTFNNDNININNSGFRPINVYNEYFSLFPKFNFDGNNIKYKKINFNLVSNIDDAINGDWADAEWKLDNNYIKIHRNKREYDEEKNIVKDESVNIEILIDGNKEQYIYEQLVSEDIESNIYYQFSLKNVTFAFANIYLPEKVKNEEQLSSAFEQLDKDFDNVKISFEQQYVRQDVGPSEYKKKKDIRNDANHLAIDKYDVIYPGFPRLLWSKDFRSFKYRIENKLKVFKIHKLSEDGDINNIENGDWTHAEFTTDDEYLITIDREFLEDLEEKIIINISKEGAGGNTWKSASKIYGEKLVDKTGKETSDYYKKEINAIESDYKSTDIFMCNNLKSKVTKEYLKVYNKSVKDLSIEDSKNEEEIDIVSSNKNLYENYYANYNFEKNTIFSSLFNIYNVNYIDCYLKLFKEVSIEKNTLDNLVNTYKENNMNDEFSRYYKFINYMFNNYMNGDFAVGINENGYSYFSKKFYSGLPLVLDTIKNTFNFINKEAKKFKEKISKYGLKCDYNFKEIFFDYKINKEADNDNFISLLSKKDKKVTIKDYNDPSNETFSGWLKYNNFKINKEVDNISNGIKKIDLPSNKKYLEEAKYYIDSIIECEKTYNKIDLENVSFIDYKKDDKSESYTNLEKLEKFEEYYSKDYLKSFYDDIMKCYKKDSKNFPVFNILLEEENPGNNNFYILKNNYNKNDYLSGVTSIENEKLKITKEDFKRYELDGIIPEKIFNLKHDDSKSKDIELKLNECDGLKNLGIMLEDINEENGENYKEDISVIYNIAKLNTLNDQKESIDLANGESKEELEDDE